ncbi:MAG: peroxide stress protein YaaA [Bacteroidales bacterium]|nr:peroxide stress protein YaaA [Bacteroidales bacterium]
MITILSPAKKLDQKTDRQINSPTTPNFLKDSQVLVEELRNFSPDELSALMNVSRNIAELNYERYSRWHTPFTPENAQPAVFMFNGQVYQGLQAVNLEDDDLQFGQEHLRILSGLYGLLRPLDLIQPYRLEMGTKLSNPRGDDLYTFWGDKLTQAINESLQQHDSRVLLNLASNEYYKTVKKDKLEGEVITPVFKEKKGDQYRTVAVYAKKARGLMSRFILRNRIDDPEAIQSFDEDGYVFSPQQSSKKEWVFVR